MSAVTIEEAQANLSKLIDGLPPGHEVTITRDQIPVARLRSEAAGPRQFRKPGKCRGMITIIAEDEEHLRDFAEHME